MIEIINLCYPLIAGLLLGMIFFGGLWWTIKKGLLSPNPAWWFLLSFLLRTGFVLTGFYFIGGRQWQRLVLCFVGFFIARFIVNHLTIKSSKNVISVSKEENNAIKS